MVHTLELYMVEEVQPLLSRACSTLVVPCLPTVSHLPLTRLERRREENREDRGRLDHH